MGYYKLTCKKTRADDWIWIIDHTIQCGREKCPAVLGIRQSKLPEMETIFCHEDVEPLALYPVKSSNGDIVYRQLGKTIPITGVPRQIIADGGTDVKAGVNRFCRYHPRTCFIYDIRHKAAAVLKRCLHIGTAWNNFVKMASRAGKQFQQTDMAAPAPPNQRSKSRYMNVDRLVKWAHKTLAFKDPQTLFPSSAYDQRKLKAKLGWITTYRIRIAQWRDLIQVVESAVGFIRFNGLFRNYQADLVNDPSFDTYSPLAKSVREELITFIKTEPEKAKLRERLLCGSEEIESVFGKLKYLKKDQSKNGAKCLMIHGRGFSRKTYYCSFL